MDGFAVFDLIAKAVSCTILRGLYMKEKYHLLNLTIIRLLNECDVSHPIACKSISLFENVQIAAQVASSRALY
jgi:hypothetical protein